MYKIETSIEIEASPEEVWAVFSDLPSYPLWSTFIESMEGSFKPGTTLRVAMRNPGMKKSMMFTPKIIGVKPHKEFRWLGKLGSVGFLFVGEHYFIFDAVDGKTKVTHGENIRGILVPFLKGMLKSTKAGFEQFNKALKKRVESS